MNRLWDAEVIWNISSGESARSMRENPLGVSDVGNWGPSVGGLWNE